MKQYNPTLEKSKQMIKGKLDEIDLLESRVATLRKEIVMLEEYQASLLRGELEPGYYEIAE